MAAVAADAQSKMKRKPSKLSMRNYRNKIGKAVRKAHIEPISGCGTTTGYLASVLLVRVNRLDGKNGTIVHALLLISIEFVNVVGQFFWGKRTENVPVTAGSGDSQTYGSRQVI